ncbi:MAG: hypothetical protein LBB20_01785 [Puniceicoccales bacterium]|jgi:hypothetical protein|nr:hypothetical protein [Puniceicoccales bacterium]
MDRDRVTIVEMERQLLGDSTGNYRKSLLARLSEYRLELTKKLNSDLLTADFNVYNKVKIALEKAQEVVNNFK